MGGIADVGVEDCGGGLAAGRRDGRGTHCPSAPGNGSPWVWRGGQRGIATGSMRRETPGMGTMVIEMHKARLELGIDRTVAKSLVDTN